jgi:hypothetical protein
LLESPPGEIPVEGLARRKSRASPTRAMQREQDLEVCRQLLRVLGEAEPEVVLPSELPFVPPCFTT